MVALFTFPGCGDGPDWQDYDRIHNYGSQEVAWAVELETEYGDADHFITHFGSGRDTIWNTVVYFGGRYELNAQCRIVVDYRARTFRASRSPEFRLFEFTSVLPGGTAMHGETFAFTIGHFETLVSNNWDFASIGIPINSKPVPNFDSYVNARRRPRRPISLLAK